MDKEEKANLIVAILPMTLGQSFSQSREEMQVAQRIQRWHGESLWHGSISCEISEFASWNSKNANG